MTVSIGLTRARRSKAALALDPIPASKVQSDPLEIAELDKHNSSAGAGQNTAPTLSPNGPLRRCFDKLDQEVCSWVEEAKLAA